MIQVFIANTDVDDLFATATDLNTLPPSNPVVNQRINAGANIPANVQEDQNGNCLLNIVAARADDPTRTKPFNNQSCGAGQVINIDVTGI
jgi:hypothetical protein